MRSDDGARRVESRASAKLRMPSGWLRGRIEECAGAEQAGPRGHGGHRRELCRGADGDLPLVGESEHGAEVLDGGLLRQTLDERCLVRIGTPG